MLRDLRTREEVLENDLPQIDLKGMFGAEQLRGTVSNDLSHLQGPDILAAAL
jgi:hypothetical protein